MRSLLGLVGVASIAAPASAVTIDWELVGDPGNAPDSSPFCFEESCGSVAYEYRISRYEVTNAQYAEFLNAKAASDPLELWKPGLTSGLTRSGTSGSYTYAVKPDFANKPVTYVSFYDALRFANWLHNGQGDGDTETGAYTLLGGTPVPSNGFTVTRNPGAITFLPSENEWYKAAYYDPLSATYFRAPTATSATTTCSLPTAAPNSANCNNVAGGVTEVGAYSGSASPHGTFDQGGNVSEWNEQIIPIFLGTPNRGLRGGSWWGPEGNLRSFDRGSLSPNIYYDAAGFRVASLVPEPGTAALVLTGLTGLSLRRKRPEAS